MGVGWPWVGSSDLLGPRLAVHKTGNYKAPHPHDQNPVGASVQLTCKQPNDREMKVTHSPVLSGTHGFPEMWVFQCKLRRVQDKLGLWVNLCVFKYNTTPQSQG